MGRGLYMYRHHNGIERGPEVYRQHNSNYWTGLIGSVITMVTKGQGYQVIVIMIVVMKQGHKISTTNSNWRVSIRCRHLIIN